MADHDTPNLGPEDIANDGHDSKDDKKNKIHDKEADRYVVEPGCVVG